MKTRVVFSEKYLNRYGFQMFNYYICNLTLISVLMMKWLSLYLVMVVFMKVNAFNDTTVSRLSLSSGILVYYHSAPGIPNSSAANLRVAYKLSPRHSVFVVVTYMLGIRTINSKNEENYIASFDIDKQVLNNQPRYYYAASLTPCRFFLVNHNWV